jgi:hypothetical protein
MKLVVFLRLVRDEFSHRQHNLDPLHLTSSKAAPDLQLSTTSWTELMVYGCLRSTATARQRIDSR